MTQSIPGTLEGLFTLAPFDTVSPESRRRLEEAAELCRF
jgi:hypothetical protein